MAEHSAHAPIERSQIVLFSPTLEDVVSEDHPVRLLDEILRQQDWSDWVTPCTDHRGRPPIHPRVLAAIVLYGLMRGFVPAARWSTCADTTSISCGWPRDIGPTTPRFPAFREESGKALKGLFRQVGRLAMAMGLVRLVEVAFDGTRVKANASRYHTWTAAKVEAALKELDALFDRMMSRSEPGRTPRRRKACLPGKSVNHLPPELATLEQRRRKLQEVLQTLQAQDEARRKEGKNRAKNPAQLPQADTDSTVMPNKEGGYAANFTPTAAMDVSSGTASSTAR